MASSVNTYIAVGLGCHLASPRSTKWAIIGHAWRHSVVHGASKTMARQMHTLHFTAWGAVECRKIVTIAFPQIRPYFKVISGRVRVMRLAGSAIPGRNRVSLGSRPTSQHDTGNSIKFDWILSHITSLIVLQLLWSEYHF